MSVETLAAVLHHSRARGTVKLVAVGIANHDGDGGAWPTIRTLAKYANVEPRNVQKAIAKLVALGELAVHVQQGGRMDTPDWDRPNRYDVLVGCPPWCDRTTQHRDTREARQSHLRGLSTGVTRATGGRGQGVTRATGGGVTPATPKPSLEPTPPVVSTQAQPARAWCSVCSRTATACATAQRKLPAAERHDYAEGNRRASR